MISSDAGRIVDDGTICRVDEDTFYVTTTSSGAGAVEEWFSWWLADWRMRVQLTDLTQGLSAVNLAGPRAREILGELTDLDCSAEAFKYLDGKHGKVAGVPCLILRIGFVGEVGYEIHFAAAYGEHVWDALMQAGRDKGIRPFGLEPQRILRLQKMHILVGQDTDSESTPFGAAMPWIVKLDKQEDFIGKWALEHYAEEEPATRLVGFTLPNGHVPTEGAVIMDARGAPVGQVTSSRFSPGARPGDRDGLGAGQVRSGRCAGDDLGRGHDDAGRDPDEAVLRPRRRGAPLVSLAFLSPAAADAGAVARSPMEGKAKAAGARFEVRDGWNVAVDYDAPSRGDRAWVDVSHLRKLELQGDDVPGELGEAKREGDAWICQLTPTRALLLGGDHAAPPDAVDVTTCFAALTIFGPQAREVIARFCALDLRPQVAPPGSFRPGSIARQPGMILVQDTDRFLLLFGWAVGEYMWTVVEDAARHLGGAPVGVEALRACLTSSARAGCGGGRAS